MADSKITDLTALTAVAETDVLAVVDVSATETKKATKAVLLAPITANGTSVGIGQASPTAELDVNGTILGVDVSVSSGSVLLNGNELNGVKVTIADNAAAALTFPTREGGFLFVGINVNSTHPQITNFSVTVPVDFGATPGYPTPVFQGSGVEMNNAAALTGTTGTDGKVTIGTAGVAGTLYIENRTGSSYQFSVTLL
jgi:hypothetical protein